MNNPIIIKIDSSDENVFLQANILFLENVKKYYELFKDEYVQFYNYWNWDKNENKIKHYIVPEKIRYVSPITIFDASWGSGKTYFFEQLIFNSFIDGKIDIKKYNFKKIITIDLWEFINSEQMINDIIWDLYNKLVSSNKKNTNKAKEIFNKILKTTGVLLINALTSGYLGLSLDLSENEKKKLEEIRKNLEDIDETIVIFDNLERLDEKSKEIIKLIQKISTINNLFIILPMNKEYFMKNSEIDNESKFDKYITLGKYFKFQQEYSNLLISKKINHKYISLINDLLKIENKNQVLSIRNLYKKLYSNDLKKYSYKNKYICISFLSNNIWECENYVKKIINDDLTFIEDILKRFNESYHQWRCKNYSSFYNYLVHNDSVILEEDKNDFIKSIFENYRSNSDYLPYVDFFKNFDDKKKLLKSHIEDIIKEKNKKIKKISNEKESFNKKIKELDNDIKEFEDKIKQNDILIQEINAKGAEVTKSDINKKAKLSNNSNNFNDGINLKKQEFNRCNNKIRELNVEIDEENNRINMWEQINSNIDNLEEQYNILSKNFKNDSDLLYLLDLIHENVMKNSNTSLHSSQLKNIITNFFFPGEVNE